MQIDAWQGHSVRTDTVSVYLQAGKDYHLKAEYYDNRDYAVAKLLQKSEMRKDIVIELSYKGFG